VLETENNSMLKAPETISEHLPLTLNSYVGNLF